MAITGDDVTLDDIIPISYDFSVVEGKTEHFSWKWKSVFILKVLSVSLSLCFSSVSSPDEFAVLGECVWSSKAMINW